MYIDQQHHTSIRSTLPSLHIIRKQIHSWYSQFQNSLSLIGWVVLGLGLITLLVTMLSGFPKWLGPILFGPRKTFALLERLPEPRVEASTMIFVSTSRNHILLLTLIFPTVSAILLYLILVALQPHLFPQGKKYLYFLLTATISLLLINVLLPFIAKTELISSFYFCILAYALIAHARVTLSKKASWLIEAVSLLTVLCIMTFFASHDHVIVQGTAAQGATPSDAPEVLYNRIVNRTNVSDFLFLQIPTVGLQLGITLQFFQFCIWVLGLLCLHIFTGIGIHERIARQHSDLLVKELTLAQEQLRAYALHAEELATIRERARVAREVHDTLAQGLAAIKMHLETGAKMFHEQPDLAYKHVERARNLAGEHLEETRNSILDLRADALNGRTLPSALASLVATWQTEHHTTTLAFCTSNREENAPCWLTIPPAIELACYRIAQEALSNATRHGQAHHIEVELSIENNDLCLTITDDGSGFDPAAIRPSRKGGCGFGIIGMHERLKLLHGRLEILSATGTGTQVVAMIPLKPAASNSLLPKELALDSYSLS